MLVQNAHIVEHDVISFKLVSGQELVGTYAYESKADNLLYLRGVYEHDPIFGITEYFETADKTAIVKFNTDLIVAVVKTDSSVLAGLTS